MHWSDLSRKAAIALLLGSPALCQDAAPPSTASQVDTLDTFGSQVIVLGNMQLTTSQFVDGLSVDLLSPTNRTMTIQRNANPLNGTFVTGTTGAGWRSVARQSYLVQMSDPTKDLVGSFQIPFDADNLKALGISPENTAVGKLAPDGRSWMVMDDQRTIDTINSRTGMAKIASLDGEYILLGRVSKGQTGNIYLPYGAGAGSTVNFTGGPGMQSAEYVDGFRISASAERAMGLTVNMMMPVAANMFPSGYMNIYSFAYRVGAVAPGTIPQRAAPGQPGATTPQQIAAPQPTAAPPAALQPGAQSAPAPSNPATTADPNAIAPPMAPEPAAQAPPGIPGMPGMPGFPAGSSMMPGMPGMPAMPAKAKRFPQASAANSTVSPSPLLATGASSILASASATPLQGDPPLQVDPSLSGGQGMITGVTATLAFPINTALLETKLASDRNATAAGLTMSNLQLVVAKRDINAPRNQQFQPITDKMTVEQMEEGRMVVENLREVPGEYAVLMVMPANGRQAGQDRQNANKQATSGAVAVKIGWCATVGMGVVAAVMGMM